MDARRTALLVMDVQVGIVERLGNPELLERLAAACEAARAAGVRVVYVTGAGETESLVLTGIATSGVALSTLRQAADRDFDLVVLSDGCADADDEVHRVLTEKVFPRQAEVLTVGEWTSSLG